MYFPAESFIHFSPFFLGLALQCNWLGLQRPTVHLFRFAQKQEHKSTELPILVLYYFDNKDKDRVFIIANDVEDCESRGEAEKILKNVNRSLHKIQAD